jgi:hypothetical protein
LLFRRQIFIELRAGKHSRSHNNLNMIDDKAVPRASLHSLSYAMCTELKIFLLEISFEYLFIIFIYFTTLAIKPCLINL